ncbi:transglycosylase SLT domain-containing protein [Spartinivicinus marinus]|nr:transglycosylase SLT domain-containing protein [Spartinivicinus marinus]MCX4030280.1 transglycosylase SLT domain-containing protein [Spartinivicinus marinus]MCX4030417.1 transglycosylase SLT domain-containing protein [Spartinivicinus marinus]
MPCAGLSAPFFPDQYDEMIRSASKLYLPEIDWRLFKAQLYQESRLKPNAVSPAGAQGLGQIMPGTWSDISRQLKLDKHLVFDPESNIQASAFYMAKMRKFWTAPRPAADKHSLALASYNAGAGNILKAQKRCNNARLYQLIIKCLPNVTSHHAKETTTYVKRIWRYWVSMLVG